LGRRKTMLKVMTIVGTRPEIIKLSRVMAELDKYTEHIIVHTGQNFDYELNEIFFKELHIRKPDYFLDAAGKNAAETIANVILKSDALMEETKPDAVLLEKPNKFDPFGQKESAHLIYHTIAPLKVLVMGVNFILPF